MSHQMTRREQSRLDRADAQESRAYAAMVDAQADVIARQLAGLEDAETARLRLIAESRRAEWWAAVGVMEDVHADEWSTAR